MFDKWFALTKARKLARRMGLVIHAWHGIDDRRPTFPSRFNIYILNVFGKEILRCHSSYFALQWLRALELEIKSNPANADRLEALLDGRNAR